MMSPRQSEASSPSVSSILIAGRTRCWRPSSDLLSISTRRYAGVYNSRPPRRQVHPSWLPATPTASKAAAQGDDSPKTQDLMRSVLDDLALLPRVSGLNFPIMDPHDRAPRLDEFQNIVHRTARLLRPVLRKLRPYGHKHDRHFVL